MRAIRTTLFASLVVASACGGGSSKEPDAMVMIIPDAPPDAPPDAAEPNFDFSCMGNTQMTPAANVTFSGFVAEVVIAGTAPDLQPAHNALVDVCKAASATCTGTDKLDTQTTPMMGCPMTGCTFTTTQLATSGSPLDVYGKVTKGTNRPTYIYPHAPLIASVANVPAVMFTPSIISALSLIGVTQQAGNANLLIAITDCANMPITDTANVNIVLKQGGQIVQGTDSFDLSQADPSLAGTYAIFNVPAGAAGMGMDPSKLTEISATWKTKPLRTREVLVFRDSTTGTQLRPGF